MDEGKDHATYLIISSGVLLKNEKLVATSWIESISEDQINLLVDSEMIKGLPEYAQ